MSRWRVMAVQETGEICCFKSGFSSEERANEYIESAGLEAQHPELRFFVEPELGGYCLPGDELDIETEEA